MPEPKGLRVDSTEGNGEIGPIESSLKNMNYEEDVACSDVGTCLVSSSDDIRAISEFNSNYKISDSPDKFEEDLLSVQPSGNDSVDLKIDYPTIDSVGTMSSVKALICGQNHISFSSINRIQTLNWPLSSWQDGPHRSAFHPYKPTTVLTNLQRGNIQTHIPQPDPAKVTWFEKAGRGDIVQQDIDDVLNVNVEDENGFTALMWAAAYGQTSTVKMLILKNADVNSKGKNGETALHFAAAGGHHDVIRLLNTNGSHIDEKDCDGNTPLMYAVFCNHPHCVNELLIGGASITVKNLSNQFPYLVAVKYAKDRAKQLMEYHILSFFLQDQRDECIFGLALDQTLLQNLGVI